MIETSKRIIARYRENPVVNNIAGLYAVQIAGYVLPLITLPYMARVLRPAGFGLMLFMQAYSLWSSVIVEYGFNFSATREVAQVQGDSMHTAVIAAAVMGAKILLLIGVALSTIIFYWIVPTFNEHPLLLLCTAPQIVAMGLSPFWYFQGTERMIKPAIVELAGRAAATAALLVVVNSPDDVWKALLTQSSFAMVVTAIQISLMYRAVPYSIPKLSEALAALNRCRSMFLFRGAFNVFGAMNGFVLGLLAPPIQVGYFGGAERISNSLQNLTTPITQALYPRISYLTSKPGSDAARMARLSLFCSVSFAVVFGVVMFFAAGPLVVLALGPAYSGSVRVVRIFGFLLPLAVMNSNLFINRMLPLGMDRIASAILAAAIAIDVAVAVILAPKFGHLGMAFSVLVAQLFILIAALGSLTLNRMTLSVSSVQIQNTGNVSSKG